MSAKAKGPTRIVSPPEKWMGPGVELERAEMAGAYKHKDGPICLISAVLTDGANVMMLSYPGGQGSLRVTDGSEKIEHHFQGRKPSYDPTVTRLWRATVQSLGSALDQRREQFGPVRPSA